MITFEQNSQAYEAYSKLRGRAGELGIVGAALVERDADGKITVPEGDDSLLGAGTAGGSLIGMLVGALGGPLGMLLGLYAGAATGLVVDASRADDQEGVLDRFAAHVPAGRSAVLAQTSEDSTAALDAAVAEFGGAIYRTPLDEVLDDLEAQNAAAEEAAAAARKAMRAERKADREADWKKRVEDLKARFHGGDAPSATA